MYNSSSRNTIANKQQNRNYRPNFAIAQHVLDTTVEIISDEKVLEINGSYWVASKFAKRYYRVVVEYTEEFLPQEKWFCSASDDRVAASCKAAVQAYIIRQQEADRQRHYEALVASGDPFVDGEEKSEEQPTVALHDGYYTVALEDDKHRTFRLRTQDEDDTFAPGKQIIGFLAGASNESDYVNFAFVIDGEIRLWSKFRHGYEKVIAAARHLASGHADEAGKMYAQESGNCYICNRTLTTPESIAAGIGPTCAKKAA